VERGGKERKKERNRAHPAKKRVGELFRSTVFGMEGSGRRKTLCQKHNALEATLRRKEKRPTLFRRVKAGGCH